MHDLLEILLKNFFLFKNWLLVGVSAIAFFGIGLLLAKFIWGRFNQRLANAIEENMNLASQWSALGSSQQDLFKKLRVRWQSDRDTFETVLAEKDQHIRQLGEQLKATGKEIPAYIAASAEDLAARARVRELESALAAEKAEVAMLREEIDKVPAFPILPFAVKGGAEPLPDHDELQTRIRDLEQDLIDTHDALHTVRADYEKQVKLVESLETKLIDTPEPVAAVPNDTVQLHALLTQRGRELRQVRHGLAASSAENAAAFRADLEAKEVEANAIRAELEAKAVETTEVRAELEAKAIETTEVRAELEAEKTETSRVRAELEAREAAELAFRAEMEAKQIEGAVESDRLLSSLRAEMEEKESALRLDLAEFDALASEARGKREDLERRFAEVSATLTDRLAEIAGLEETLQVRETELAELEVLRKRKSALQAELNDVHHELYDVRRALNLRIEAIGDLESRLQDLTETEATTAALAQSLTLDLTGVRDDLSGVREELAANLFTLAAAETSRANAEAEILALQSTLATTQAEAELVGTQLNDARRELSEVRIALSAKSEDYQKALGQMEELEAIIGDRSAEVNDLSAELRQQRDQARLLKNTLAETQGELEALADESRILNAGVKARTLFTEEQQARIAALELALAERYRELNRARVESDEQTRNAKHYESRATQLESELDRRSAEFVLSDSRLATFETALEKANHQILSLTERLEASESSLGQLRDELQSVSREKDETLRDLDRATRRVSELEEAARRREVQLVEIERELIDTRNLIAPLESRVGQLQVELEKAREEHHAIGEARAEIEEVARARSSQLAEIERELSETRSLIAPLEQRSERLQVELESAREEHGLTGVAIAELEASLRSGDERTLQLSAKLDEKEAEVVALAEEVAQLQALVDARSAGETEAQERLAALEASLEEKVAALRREHESETAAQAREVAHKVGEIDTLREQMDGQRSRLAAEIETLREQRDEQTTRLAEETAQREASLTEVELLREKLAARTESIRDLQNQISNVMMQRAARDTEIALLKDKLRAMEENFANELAALPVAIEAPFAMIAETHEEEGIPLDEVPQMSNGASEHSHAVAMEAAPEPPEKWAGSDEDLNVFFNEGVSTLSRAEMDKIDRCAKSIRRLGKKVEVTVIGYAGSEGSPDQNESLSARRADAVRERLVERGVSLGVVKIRAAGQDRRFSDWKARRVEMVVSPIAVAETVN